MTRVPIARKVLNENDRLAAELRRGFETHGTLCVNLISSPGSGKTMLLERTLASFDPSRRVAVLTGDIQTDNDAQRLARYGFPVRQITTGGACHLDARMVAQALGDWQPDAFDLLLIENVGNLVCPSSYDLGEEARVVLFSVTEGEDKPLKYPATFHRADLVVLNKIDLLPYVPFRIDLAREYLRRVQPEIEIVEVSCTTGAGLDTWREWLDRRARTAERHLSQTAELRSPPA
ncbi:MAG TPA: hydrogenase nickel incorporation protein HypB [Bryobacteraceae bacterium]|nr:hydrogenase nickel incorporation protein HypB [Bryobacteraceae bacterium]